MPQKQKHRTKLNQRVVLKGEVTHMYEWARAYNEAIVRRQKHDDLGFPVVYIEWDKDHWAYSGEPDRWVLEAHFDPVEEKMADDKFQDLLKGLAELVASHQDDDKRPDKPEVPEDERDDHTTLTYESVLQKGVQEALENGEGYLLFVASNQEIQGHKVTVPLLYMHSKSDEGALLVDAAAADHVAHSMGRLIHDYVRAKAERDGSSST